jgi:hypothetical protein
MLDAHKFTEVQKNQTKPVKISDGGGMYLFCTPQRRQIVASQVPFREREVLALWAHTLP